MIDETVRDWLLDSDPTLRWQVERDLLDEPAEVWRATRARIPLEGDGARLLSYQDPDGQWAGGAFFPGGFDVATQDEIPGQPYTATTWTLTTLREWGMDAAALGDTADRLAVSARWEYDDLPYWDGEVDVCINAMTLANGAWLGRDMSPLAAWFAAHQLPDGGWNCEWVDGSVRSSFHSTINAVRGLLAYEELTGDSSVTASRRRGEEHPPVDRRTGRTLDGSARVSLPSAVQCAEGRRPRHRGGRARRHPARSACRGHSRDRACRLSERRSLAAGVSLSRRGVVPPGCRGR